MSVSYGHRAFSVISTKAFSPLFRTKQAPGWHAKPSTIFAYVLDLVHLCPMQKHSFDYLVSKVVVHNAPSTSHPIIGLGIPISLRLPIYNSLFDYRSIHTGPSFGI